MTQSPTTELPNEWQRLLKASRSARTHAYAPYSKYSVGASVITEQGQIYSGCNVENSSYGLTICAERVAACSAVSAGEPKIVAVAISLSGVAVPCGTCRQFLYEFNPDMAVIIDDLSAGEQKIPEIVSLNDLLPRGFRLIGPNDASREDAS